MTKLNAFVLVTMSIWLAACDVLSSERSTMTWGLEFESGQRFEQTLLLSSVDPVELARSC